MPLRRTPTDTQLARFIEEKNPGLKDSLVSAVDAIKNARPEQLTFVHLLTKDVLDQDAARTLRRSGQQTEIQCLRRPDRHFRTLHCWSAFTSPLYFSRWASPSCLEV